MGNQLKPGHVLSAALLKERYQQMRGFLRTPGDFIDEARIGINGEHSSEFLMCQTGVETINSDYPFAFRKIIEQDAGFVCEAIELHIAVHGFKVHLSARHLSA